MGKKKPVTNEQIGALIRAARHAAGLKQDELGEKIGVTFQMVQKYETGKTGVSVLRLIEIAAALRCSVTELLP